MGAKCTADKLCPGPLVHNPQGRGIKWRLLLRSLERFLPAGYERMLMRLFGFSCDRSNGGGDGGGRGKDGGVVIVMTLIMIVKVMVV